MAIEFLPQSSLFIGIIPALALIYLIIRKWTGNYQEKMVFLMFVFGIISGFTVIFVEFYVGLTTLLEFVIIFRLIEIMGKMIILNLRRFQEKQETVLYGLVLGLGFGSIYPPVSLLLINAVSVSTFDIISVLIGSIGMILIQGSTGAILGYGVFKRNLIIPISLTLVLHVIFHYLLFELVFTWTWILFFGGIISYLIAMKKIVYPVLDQSKRRKRRTDNKPKLE
jgi:hypothetical protein